MMDAYWSVGLILKACFAPTNSTRQRAQINSYSRNWSMIARWLVERKRSPPESEVRSFPSLLVLCAVCCVLCAVCCVLCAVCCVLCCVLCAVCCVLCAVCCVLCAVVWCAVVWCEEERGKGRGGFLLLVFCCSLWLCCWLRWWLCRGVVFLLSSSSCVAVCSCLFVPEMKFLDLLENELPRKHLPMMFSLIKNEGYGIKDFKVPSSSNHKPCRLEGGRLEIGHR